MNAVTAMKRRKSVVYAGYFLAVLLVVNAACASFFSVLSPWLDDHRDWLEQLAGRVLGQPVTTSHVYARWDVFRFAMVFGFSDVSVDDPETRKPTFTISQVRIWPCFWRSLLHQKPVADKILLRGMTLMLPEVLPPHDNSSADSVFSSIMAIPPVVRLPPLVFALEHLVLQDVLIGLPYNGEIRQISLLNLDLQNHVHHHFLEADALFMQENPAPAKIQLRWQDDGAHRPSSGKISIYLEDISPDEWLGSLPIRQFVLHAGPSSIHLWATLKEYQWQEVQALAEFYQVVLNASGSEKEKTFQGVSGHFGWRRTKTGEEWAGTDILIDFPDHLWPATHFDIIKTAENPSDQSAITANFGYFSLDDLGWFAGTFLPENLKNWIAVLSPSAVVASLQIATKGNGGSASVRAEQIRLTLPKIFAAPLKLDKLSGSLSWQMDDTGTLLLSMPQAEAFSKDGSISARGELAVPKTGYSRIRLVANFALSAAAHVSRWLPLHYFHPGLSSWLSQAFTAGKMTEGRAELSGNLGDYPFDHGEGVFVVSGIVSDLGLHIATGMPDIQGANGTLNFSGRNMRADLQSARLSHIALSGMHVTVDGMGNDVAKLAVSGNASVTGLPVPVSLNADLGASGISAIQFVYDGVPGTLNFSKDGTALVKLPQLHLSSSGGVSQMAFKPDELPAIGFSVDKLWYGKQFLGRLGVSLSPAKGGIQVSSITLTAPSYSLTASGSWLSDGTHVKGNLQAARTDRFLEAFGQNMQGIEVGNGNLTFDLSWRGNPSAFSLKNLSGKLSLKLGRGRITRLDQATANKMELGRMLNIFSLQTLPRRLSLDFSDLFEKGYGFDSVQGDFALGGGNAETENMSLKGLVAEVDVSGRFGLIQQDYDLNLSITPHVTASLPMVAAVAVNPIVGVAALIAENLTSSQVSRMSTYHYLITGPWSKPVWKKVDDSEKRGS